MNRAWKRLFGPLFLLTAMMMGCSPDEGVSVRVGPTPMAGTEPTATPIPTPKPTPAPTPTPSPIATPVTVPSAMVNPTLPPALRPTEEPATTSMDPGV